MEALQRPSPTSSLPVGLDATASSLQSNARPLASSGPVTLFIRLAEPILFLQGSEHDGDTTHAPVMLRGCLVLRITKATKLRSISLTFAGRARTEWPEGIPPKKIDNHEEETLMSHTWPFFRAQWAASQNQTNADSVRPFKSSDDFRSSEELSIPTNTNSRRSRDLKRSSIQLTVTSIHNALPSTVLAGGDYDRTAQNSGYLIFQPGEYFYNFEHPVDTRMPESCLVDLGSVKYSLEALVERAGAWTSNLRASRDVELVRYPSDPSLEQVEPIAISRSWEDQLHYEVVISGKTFSLGSQIPIAIKLTPLAKVQIHRIRVILIEHVDYYARKRTVHRSEPPKSIQLLEKSASGPALCAFNGSSIRILSGGGVDYDHRSAAARGQEVPTSRTNILGDLAQEENVGPTEMELSVQLPDCSARDRIHPATSFRSIQIHHWIKILLRISRPDASNSSRRRHFEISIDSPINILSCRATPQNLSLPAYGEMTEQGMQRECGCRNAIKTRRSSSYRGSPKPNSPTFGTRPLASPPLLASRSSASSGVRTRASTTMAPQATSQQQLARPIHLLRYPSFAPPAWNAEDAPPLVTPPPAYDQSVDGQGGLADYFSRLADEDDEDDRLHSWHRGTGRVGVPLTPGGRVHRSFDILR